MDVKKFSLLTVGCVLLLTGGVVASAALLSRFALNIKSSDEREKTVTVKGVGEKNIIADLGAFECEISCTAKDIPSGYLEINRINKILHAKLHELKISKEWIENEFMQYHPVYKTVRIKENTRESTQEVFSHYHFEKSFRIRSNDVKTLENAALQLYSLSGGGINIKISSVEYYISNPEQYKLELVDMATKSAWQRANTVASTCGAQLGKLITARQGVIQITRPASNDTSDYGMYDTRTINKVMRLVVTLVFSLE